MKTVQTKLIIILLTLSLLPIPTMAQFSHDPSGNEPTDDDYLRKIADDIDLNSNSAQKTIVHFSDNYKLPDKVLGLPIDYKFKSINAVEITLTTSQIHTLSMYSSVKLIESNPRIYPLLRESTDQIGVSSSFWDNGLIGSDDMSVAILDTGIDPTHSAFDGKIIATYNAIDGNKTSVVDTHGHGTHVSGIAAGTHDLSNDKIVETDRGILPDSCNNEGCPMSLLFQLENIEESTKVDVTLDWGKHSTTNAGSSAGFAIFDPNTSFLACESCFVSSKDGIMQKSLTLDAGSYYVGAFANDSESASQPYEASISYTKQGTTESQHPASAGMAYGAKIVSVKVLEGLSGGEISVFDSAVQWIIKNRETYNISVVNLSLGLNQTNSALDAMMVSLVDNGILPVVAAGNAGIESGGVYSPASAPESLAVGSINAIGEVAFYTNKGSISVNSKYPKPDVLAPGGSIASPALGFKTGYELGFGMITAPDANIGYNLEKDDLTGYMGTSMAAPHIAGLALLLAGYMHEQDGWDWSSRHDVMKIKRMILSGTFEVGNIGYGREQLPNSRTLDKPKINRDSKDFHEGWGAVDARAVYGLHNNSIDIGLEEDLSFSLDDRFGQKSHGFRMTLQPSVNYGFRVNVPEGVDLDIKIIKANDGPKSSSGDYGDLKVMQTSLGGIGEQEAIGLGVAEETDVFVIVSIIDGPGKIKSTFRVEELTTLPKISFISPYDGQELHNPIMVEFSSTVDTVNLYVDGRLTGSIQSGYELDTLSPGSHSLRLVVISDTGYSASTMISVVIIEDTTSDDGLLSYNQFRVISSFILFIIIVRWNKLQRKDPPRI